MKSLYFFLRRWFAFAALLTVPASLSFAQSGAPVSNAIPVVTIVATDPTASAVTGDTGTFTLYRAGDTNATLNVYVTIGGTASNGVDYATLPNFISIPAGVSSVDVTVSPVVETQPDPDETVVLHLAPSPLLTPVNYVIGTPDTAVVTILGNTTNHPPSVTIISPTNGATFSFGSDIFILASASDPDGFLTIKQVEFFADGTSIGIATNYPFFTPIAPFHIDWSNAPAGGHILTAVATDDHGATGNSGPVQIFVTTSTLPPVVTIYAPDPIAVEGTNFICYRPAASVFTNFCSGTNTATFLVRREDDTNADLTVYYAIGGTASNGVDYVMIPNNVTIPAGRRFALVTIVPLEDIDPTSRRFDTVILALTPAPTTTATNPPPYLIGRPDKAEAIILEDRELPGPPTCPVPDKTFHLCLPGTNGLIYCLQASSNLVDWVPLCTNMVVKGTIHFLDPDACEFPGRYYRVVPAAGLPDY